MSQDSCHPTSSTHSRLPSHDLPIRRGLVASLVRRIESPSPSPPPTSNLHGSVLPGKLHLYSASYGQISSCISVMSHRDRPRHVTRTHSPIGAPAHPESTPLPQNGIVAGNEDASKNTFRDFSSELERAVSGEVDSKSVSKLSHGVARDFSLETSSSMRAASEGKLQCEPVRKKERRDPLNDSDGGLPKKMEPIRQQQGFSARFKRRFNSLVESGIGTTTEGQKTELSMPELTGDCPPVTVQTDDQLVVGRAEVVTPNIFLSDITAAKDPIAIGLTHAQNGRLAIPLVSEASHFPQSASTESHHSAFSPKSVDQVRTSSLRSKPFRYHGRFTSDRHSRSHSHSHSLEDEIIIAPLSMPAGYHPSSGSLRSPSTSSKPRHGHHKQIIDFFERFSPGIPSISRRHNGEHTTATHTSASSYPLSARERQILDYFARLNTLPTLQARLEAIQTSTMHLSLNAGYERDTSASSSLSARREAALDFFHRFTPTPQPGVVELIAQEYERQSHSESASRSHSRDSGVRRFASTKLSGSSLGMQAPVPSAEDVPAAEICRVINVLERSAIDEQEARFCGLCGIPSPHYRVCMICYWRMCAGCRSYFFGKDEITEREIVQNNEVGCEQQESDAGRSVILSVNKVSGMTRLDWIPHQDGALRSVKKESSSIGSGREQGIGSNHGQLGEENTTLLAADHVAGLEAELEAVNESHKHDAQPEKMPWKRAIKPLTGQAQDYDAPGTDKQQRQLAAFSELVELKGSNQQYQTDMRTKAAKMSHSGGDDHARRVQERENNYAVDGGVFGETGSKQSQIRRQQQQHVIPLNEPSSLCAAARIKRQSSSGGGSFRRLFRRHKRVEAQRMKTEGMRASSPDGTVMPIVKEGLGRRKSVRSSGIWGSLSRPGGEARLVVRQGKAGIQG